MISRNHILGIGLAVGILFASGTGLAAADTPSPVPPVCAIPVTPAPTPVPVAKDPSGRGPRVPCGKFVRAVPKGAPQTGGGGMAAEVGSWG